MAKFIYNNAKNASSSHILFELNYSYYSQMFYKKNIIFCFKSKLSDKLLAKLRKLVIVYKKNFHYFQKF